MDVNPSASHRESHDAAEAAREVIELLEVLWERGKDAVSTAPVSTSQLRVLYAVEHEEGISLRALSEVLGAAPSSASRLCDRLQALGFIDRSPSPSSGRELQLRLTGKGLSYLFSLRAQREEALLPAIATMPAATRTALVKGLTGLQWAVEATAPTQPQAPPHKGAQSA
ncbi:MarR family winged helix-turn-helix transcriptional regulator [Streptomyces sioyaensis]|uniref:MarR family winged helix-turn-helix transcriptional regulator n=1 Tax=Streptomyces sioyaensis TaxID=67364 RepID=UPI0037128507